MSPYTDTHASIPCDNDQEETCRSGNLTLLVVCLFQIGDQKVLKPQAARQLEFSVFLSAYITVLRTSFFFAVESSI